MALRRRHRRPSPRALNIYLDSSAWVKLFISEPGAKQVQTLWNAAEGACCVSIGYVEVCAALARRLPAPAARRGRRRLDRQWGEVQVIDVGERLIVSAARLATRHRLRALDALHLASALATRLNALTLVSWDGELRRAAAAEGLAVSPARPQL